jgi:RimJ/RimL family protein N-acetyltransferase
MCRNLQNNSEHIFLVKNGGIIVCMEKELNKEQLDVVNWPGYQYPLAFRFLQSSDAVHLYSVMKNNAKHLRGYVGWAKYSSSWNFDTVQKFVDDHVNSEWPRFHLIFTIGKKVVGFGSIAPMNHPRDVQVALWVDRKHGRRGLGPWIVTVLEWYAFNVFGFDNVYYQHDVTNRKSGAIPKKLGYTFSHTFEEVIDGTKESGIWISYVKAKPKKIHPGAIDTGTLSNWEGITFPWKCLI